MYCYLLLIYLDEHMQICDSPDYEKNVLQLTDSAAVGHNISLPDGCCYPLLISTIYIKFLPTLCP